MLYVLIVNDAIVFRGATLAEVSNFVVTVLKKQLSENDTLYLYKLDKTATITTTINL